MQDPFGFPDHSYSKQPKVKPPRKQVGLLQPKATSLPSGSSTPFQAEKIALPKVAKTVMKKTVREPKHGSSFSKEAKNYVHMGVSRPVIDMMKVTEGDSRSLYRTLKRKYASLEEESFRLVEELEKTEEEVKGLEEEKMGLLDDLLVLEGLAFNPYPPVQLPLRNYTN